MTSKNKAKGSAWERAIVQQLRTDGFDVERMYGAGRQDDRGDIRGLDNWTIEAKDHGKFALSEWLQELDNEMSNAGTEYGAVLIKKRQAATDQAYILVPWSVLIKLLRITNA
jgi:hypothetical protein